MKKFVACSCVLILLVVCLTGCDLFKDMFNNIKNPESLPKTEEMLKALEENRVDDAQALMHPSVNDGSTIKFEQMIGLLNGRTVTSVQQMNISINKSIDLAGEATTETATYKVNLSDGSTLLASVEYLTNSAGSGFVLFLLSVGA